MPRSQHRLAKATRVCRCRRPSRGYDDIFLGIDGHGQHRAIFLAMAAIKSGSSTALEPMMTRLTPASATRFDSFFTANASADSTGYRRLHKYHRLPHRGVRERVEKAPSRSTDVRREPFIGPLPPLRQDCQIRRTVFLYALAQVIARPFETIAKYNHGLISSNFM